ncbi:MAG: hypothetical protein U9N81_02235 [Bacillota bacterium]|nr:hypothetical protein [Bacillota bacterium]
MSILKKMFLLELMFVFIWLCAGCTGNPAMKEEPPDIQLAKKWFYQEGRTMLVDFYQNYTDRIPSDAAGFLPDITVSKLEKAELGRPLRVWLLKQAQESWQIEFSAEEEIIEQIVFENMYLFPVVADGKRAADYQVSVENGQITGASCGLGISRYAYEAADLNGLDIEECYLIAAPGEILFPFSREKGREICSGELRINPKPDLTMNESHVKAFKTRATEYNRKVQIQNEEPNINQPGEIAPMGKAPPRF